MAESESLLRQKTQASTLPRTSSACHVNGIELKYGYLCIDVGTTATRLAFGSRELKGRFNDRPSIVNRGDTSGNRFESSDWPSAMQCFDLEKPPKDCIGFINDNPDSLPVKMYLYVYRVHMLHRRNLPGDAAAIYKIRKLIPQVRDFLIRFDQLEAFKQDKVIDHGLKIYITHLRQLKAESEKQALAENIEIKELGATIPPNWDNWIQTFFIRILNVVWDSIDEDSIELIKEPHAAANWLMWLSPEMQQLKPRQVVLVDFGGHTLSYDAFHINHHAEGSDRFSIAALWDTKCIHAGSELHAANVRREVLEDIPKQAKKNPLPLPKEKLYEKLMRYYHFGKHEEFCTGQMFSLTYNPPQSRNRRSKREAFTVDFSNTRAQELYDQCFGKALRSLQKLVDSPRIKRGSIVVLTGGSFRNEHVREQAEKMIRKGGLHCPEWPKSRTVGNSRAARIVSGAVMCLVNAGTVSDFMARAAFAVRFNISNVITAHTIWNRGQSLSITKKLGSSQGGDIHLICSPKGIDGDISPRPLEGDFFENAYDFHLLDKYKKDTLRITMTYRSAEETETSQDEIILKVEYLTSRAPCRVLRWPIFFDKSAGLCLVDNMSRKVSQPQAPNVNERDKKFTSLRRVNLKGERARQRWEHEHNDSGSFYWGKLGETEPLEDIMPSEIQRASTATLDDPNPSAADDDNTGPVPPRPCSPSVTLRPQNDVPARQQTRNEGGLTSSLEDPNEQNEQRRKRRGTSSSKVPTATKRKADQRIGIATPSNCSFTMATLVLAPDEREDGSQRRPYAIMDTTQQSPVAEQSGDRDRLDHSSTIHDAAAPRSSQRVDWAVQTSHEGFGIHDATEGGDQHRTPLLSQPFEPLATQVAAVYQEPRSASPAPRLPPGQPIVSEHLQAEINYYLDSWEARTSGGYHGG